MFGSAVQPDLDQLIIIRSARLLHGYSRPQGDFRSFSGYFSQRWR